MKTNIKTSIIFISLFYVIPLIGNLGSILTIQFLIISIACVILLMTQPPLTINETVNNRSNDKHSVWLIMGFSALIQVSMVVEWSYFGSQIFELNLQTLIGISMIIFGSLFRIKSIQKLGKHFTVTVRTQEDQKIIKTGIYQYLRHPSYLGAFIAIVGATVFLNAQLSMYFAIISMFLTYVYRIRVEEKTLVAEFGSEYENYQKETNRMIPFIY